MMGFKSRELSVLAYANGFTLWHYRTEDPLADLLDPALGAFENAGYFGAACDLLCAGDQILVNLNGGSRPSLASLVVEHVNPGGQVRVANAAPVPIHADRNAPLAPELAAA